MTNEGRRIPRVGEFRSLVNVRRPRFGVAARLASANTISDLRRIGARRTPRAVFDYVDGGADAEISMSRARADFGLVEFHPAVLRDVSDVNMSTTVLGVPSALPLGLGPTGNTQMMHHGGERAVARAAGEAGLIYTLATLGTTTAADLAINAPETTKWFQLYMPRDRGLGRDLISAANEAGFTALVLTVDTAVPGLRLRDVRNGLTYPPSFPLRTLAGMAVHPRWWFEVLTREPLTFASLRNWPVPANQLLEQALDPALSRADVEWVRDMWHGPLVVKGILRTEDARLAFDLGADAIVLSNHGGRQLDRAVTPLRVLPRVVSEHGGRGDIYLDSGITNGADIVAAVALGAKLCFVGRAYLYGLMAGGKPGVDRAITILSSEIRRTMQLLGAKSLSDLRPDMVTIRNN